MCQILAKPLNYGLRFFKYRQNGNISPNLVTLALEITFEKSVEDYFYEILWRY